MDSPLTNLPMGHFLEELEVMIQTWIHEGLTSQVLKANKPDWKSRLWDELVFASSITHAAVENPVLDSGWSLDLGIYFHVCVTRFESNYIINLHTCTCLCVVHRRLEKLVGRWILTLSKAVKVSQKPSTPHDFVKPLTNRLNKLIVDKWKMFLFCYKRKNSKMYENCLKLYIKKQEKGKMSRIRKKISGISCIGMCLWRQSLTM